MSGKRDEQALSEVLHDVGNWCDEVDANKLSQDNGVPVTFVIVPSWPSWKKNRIGGNMETKTRIEFAWKLVKAAWKLFLEKERAVVILLKLSQDIRTKLADEFTPSKDLVRNAVERMPYQPFGVPGLTDTTKYDGNLTEQYPDETRKAVLTCEDAE